MPVSIIKMHQSNYILLFLFLCVSLFCIGVANAASIDIHAANKKCVACHNNNLKEHIEIPALSSYESSNECLQCHAENDVSASFLKVAQLNPVSAEDARPENSAGDSQFYKKASGKGPGMNVTMYYKKSRIGDQPNEMIMIPEGEFIMGSNTRLPDEGPQHKVSLKAFWIDKFEVTNYQYKKFIDVTKRRSPNHFENRTFPEDEIDHPVTFVSWKDAKAYCKWADKRLPADQEWEKAARGTKAQIYPWGDVYDTNKVNSPQRWMELKLEGGTTPVGAFEEGKSPYGLYDMSGNVWEWTASWYEAYPGNTDSSESYGQIYKTLKGGSWWDCSFYKCGISAPTYNRSFFLRSTKNKSFGFRCARDA